jgi:hypothetical protein
MKLAGYYEAKKPIPWVRIYQLPEYVYFSHSLHHEKAKIGCELCHGPVAERDTITKEKAISMTACMDCHSERGASVKCNRCHSPNP